MFFFIRLFGNGTLGLVTVFSSGGTGVGGLRLDVCILRGIEFSYVATMSLDDLLDGRLILSFHVLEERIFRVYMHKLSYSYDGNLF